MHHPTNCVQIAAHALLTGCDRTLAEWCGADDEALVLAIAHHPACLLRWAGEPETAPFLAQLGRRCNEHHEAWAGREDGGTGRRFAEELRVAAGLSEQLEKMSDAVRA
jgi:hypothetical protein